MSEIYQEIDKDKSYYYAQRIIEFINELSEKNKIRFYLEYLIRCFYLNKFTENIEIYFNCTKLILQNISEKGLVAMFIHIVNYIIAYIVSGIELDKETKEYIKPYTRMTIYSENMNNDLDIDKKIQAIYLHTFKLLSFSRNKEKTLEFTRILYDYAIKDKPGSLILFPIESIVFLIEKFMFKEAFSILKIRDIFKNNKETVLLKNSKENPLGFVEEINNIYQIDNNINLKDMSEFFIFNIIFLMIEENKEVRINKIKELEEFQKLPQKIKEEYINIMEFIQNKNIIPIDYLKGIIVKKNTEKDITFEIIYRILLINQLCKKELINSQINLIIYFISSYECFSTEKTLLVLFIRKIREAVENNNEYRNKDKILREIETFGDDINIENAKKIYIEILVDIGFEDITDENLNWLKEK